MRKNFYLIDYDHDKNSKRKDKFYMVAANIALKYGSFGNHFSRCDEINIQEFWDGDDSPCMATFMTHIRVPIVKWYIHNRFDFSGQIWNGDFLHGIATVGKIRWNERTFPTLDWRSNNHVFELLKKCGFGGNLKQYIFDKNHYKWNGVPALYLKGNESSISFMAGVLATGTLFEKDKKIYAKYHRRQKEFFIKWFIPIEYENPNRAYFLASPIWTALFVPYMPEECRKIWYNLKKPYGEDIYPPILWKTYVNNKFPTRGIPYLKSRRWIFNHYYSEKGAMKTLEKERVERNLTQLDKRIREMVHEWSKNLKEGIKNELFVN